MSSDHFTRDPSNANAGTARGRAIIAASIAARGAGRSGLAASDGTMIAGIVCIYDGIVRFSQGRYDTQQ